VPKHEERPETAEAAKEQQGRDQPHPATVELRRAYEAVVEERVFGRRTE
jgi:hypothetical protein